MIGEAYTIIMAEQKIPGKPTLRCSIKTSAYDEDIDHYIRVFKLILAGMTFDHETIERAFCTDDNPTCAIGGNDDN